MKSFVAAILHDPDGVFAPLIEDQCENLKKVADHGLLVVTSTVTHHQTIDAFTRCDGQMIIGDMWGSARINALQYATDVQRNKFFLLDFDKLLHWLNFNPSELFTLLEAPMDSEMVVLGRGDEEWKTYPNSWVRTEKWANSHYARILGEPFDIMAGQLMLSRTAVRILAENAYETGWKNCGELPLIAWKHRLRITSRICHGLTWEDPDRLPLSAEEIKEKYDSTEEWDKRSQNARDIVSLLGIPPEPLEY